MKYIKRFDEVSIKDISIVGGKGANLGEMFQAGLPVPKGFCITANAFDEYMIRNSLNDQDFNSSGKLEAFIAVGQIWSDLEQEITESYETLGHNMRIAVRSSATAEDLPEASFAGQQETYLNVVGKEQLMTAIKKCFASLYSIRAVTYRKQADFDSVKVSLAVVIQIMVESEISGVLFTADPVSQDKELMMLNASWGLGEAIVSGKVTPDIYMYSKKQRGITDKKLGGKEIIICCGTTGVEERKTPQEQKDRLCLSDRQALEVFEMGRKAEQHYDSPQDIEWAISKGKLYLLQSRPITTLNKTKERQTEISTSLAAVLSNWIEHCPTPLYPLDVEPCAIVDKAKAKVFQELGISLGSDLTMDEKGVLFFSTAKKRISPRIAKVPFLIRRFTNYSTNSAITSQNFLRIKNKLNEKSELVLSQLSVSELVLQLKELMDLSEEIAYIRFRYNIFPSVAVSKLLYPVLHRIDKSINEYDLLSNLPYKTWEMNAALRKLSIYIQNHAELKETIACMNRTDSNATKYSNLIKESNTNKDSNAIKDSDSIKDGIAIKEHFPDFYDLLQKFLEEFGWKSNSSYCAFGSVSWKEDMSSLFSLIKVLLKSDKKDTENGKYQTILSKIDMHYTKKKASKIRTKIEEIRGYHVNREESLYLIEMCYGLSRRIAFELNLRFPDIFNQQKDILYLTLSEVYDLAAGEKDYKDRIEIRKANRPQNERLWANLSLGGQFDNKNTLRGISGNRGQYRGRVRKIVSLQEFDKMQPEDILVCRYTDPSWTPLFVLAAAVVSDTGGPLSHSAIVAREYDIPAVLGCGNATEVLQDGQEIVVDGDKGVVRIIS
ncbi:PEP/pyruvate-binding domain-containing protein [Anaerocolumna sp. AGMB13025]|uniref:PEP/pyruvate-binding domain-containing protein n=1 Tax=Anaerocolumna sp. AGMB13025 TaxID=3039116 RepID=UPI00241DD55B|nr:PEP/pyruvate-binding domain-containing protein [Anaerocolumna sp. AGMB13025]WFR58555.1 PEP/pyruvate-binding domain-containing protein [Anaerocolumna sp. AGMB13025]